MSIDRAPHVLVIDKSSTLICAKIDNKEIIPQSPTVERPVLQQEFLNLESAATFDVGEEDEKNLNK